MQHVTHYPPTPHTHNTHTQFERVLYSEQRRSDFQPRDDELSFDKPTAACLLGTGMLAALGGAARVALEGPNLTALLSEVCLYLALLACLLAPRVCWEKVTGMLPLTARHAPRSRGPPD